MTRSQLRAHLIATRIAGDVATPREANLRNYRRFAGRDPGATLGLDPVGAWTESDVLALLAERCGVDPDPAYRQGPDRIDPDRTLDALDALAETLHEVADARGDVLVGTGHPTTLVGLHAGLAQALGAAGCAVRTPARHKRFLLHAAGGERDCALDYAQRVGVVKVYEEVPRTGAASSGGAVGGEGPGTLHTHSPQPVRVALAALAEAGHRPPGLVIGDHGWVCGAGRLGVRAVGFADSNDPALFVGEAEGEVAVTVPLDDGVRPDYYGPLTGYVLQRAGLSR